MLPILTKPERGIDEQLQWILFGKPLLLAFQIDAIFDDGVFLRGELRVDDTGAGDVKGSLFDGVGPAVYDDGAAPALGVMKFVADLGMPVRRYLVAQLFDAHVYGDDV